LRILLKYSKNQKFKKTEKQFSFWTKSKMLFQVQEQKSPPKAAQVVKDCCKVCIDATYRHTYNECMDQYQADKQERNSVSF